MKKISRKDFQGLQQNSSFLGEKNIKHSVNSISGGYGDWFEHGFGGYDPDGNYHWYSGYSREEFDNWDGYWPGGWVYGLGYVGPDMGIYNSYNDNNESYGGAGEYGESEPDLYGGGGNDWGFNIGNAVDYLDQYALSYSTGTCAKSVRLALEAGGFSTVGHPASACDYETFLQARGFSVVEKDGYIPIIGDIVVHEATTGHPHGHIAMFDGNKWVSDFVQNDMFGGSAFRNAKNYTILRWDY